MQNLTSVSSHFLSQNVLIIIHKHIFKELHTNNQHNVLLLAYPLHSFF